MRLRAQGHPRENIENEILSEFRYMTIGARRNVEEHGTCFSKLRSYARIWGLLSPSTTRTLSDTDTPSSGGIRRVFSVMIQVQ
jgi:hypothetical protein